MVSLGFANLIYFDYPCRRSFWHLLEILMGLFCDPDEILTVFKWDLLEILLGYQSLKSPLLPPGKGLMHTVGQYLVFGKKIKPKNHISGVQLAERLSGREPVYGVYEH